MTSMRASSGVSYVHGASDTSLIGETIGSCLARQVAAHGDQDAIVSCHQRLRYSYRAFDREVRRAARGLITLGVEKGGRVGIWSANCVEGVVTQYAAAAVGAILVNINPAYRLRELEYALNQSGISLLVTARRFRNTDYVAMLVELCPNSARQSAVISGADACLHSGTSYTSALASAHQAVWSGPSCSNAEAGVRRSH